MESWIKIYRKFTDWEWYQDGNTVRVFLHLLITANFEDKTWRGVLIKRGQTIAGRKGLAKDLKLSEMQIRTALTRLKTTSEITIETTNMYSIVTICKYEDYQGVLTKGNQGNNPPAIPPATTPKEEKEIKNTTHTLGRTREEESGEIIEYIPPEILKCIPPELNYPKFIHVWDYEWGPYRKGRSLPGYQVPVGLKSTLSGLRNKSKGDVKKAIEAIRYSIEMNWQGIFPERTPQMNTGSGVNGKRKQNTRGAKASKHDNYNPSAQIQIRK